MDLYKLISAGLNVREGIGRFGGNQALYEKYLRKFPNDPEYGLLCGAIGEKDAAAAFAAAHTLKGVAGNLSMTRLYDALVPLVEELRGGSFGRSEQLLTPVGAAYDAVIAAISEGE